MRASVVSGHLGSYVDSSIVWLCDFIQIVTELLCTALIIVLSYGVKRVMGVSYILLLLTDSKCLHLPLLLIYLRINLASVKSGTQQPQHHLS